MNNKYNKLAIFTFLLSIIFFYIYFAKIFFNILTYLKNYQRYIIITFLTFILIIIAIYALHKIKYSNEKGKIFAISGIIISVLMFTLFISPEFKNTRGHPPYVKIIADIKQI